MLANRFHTSTSCSGSLNGRGLNNTAFATLKMATLLPMPSASVKTSTAVYPGRLTKPRRAYLRSCLKSFIVANANTAIQMGAPVGALGGAHVVGERAIPGLG